MKTLASAVKTFETQKSEEIGFSFGDTIKIDVPNQIDQWCKAEIQTGSSSSKTGWVPRSHLKIMVIIFKKWPKLKLISIGPNPHRIFSRIIGIQVHGQRLKLVLRI